MTRKKHLFASGLRGGFLALLMILNAQAEWRSFELRYHSASDAANGETDFRGETAYFNTDQRIEYLQRYEQVAGRFFENSNWDQVVVSDEEAKVRLATIKPQPLPSVRKRLNLETWRWMGFKAGILEQETRAIAQWETQPNTTVQDGHLLVGATTVKHAFDEQSWRFKMRWTVSVNDFNDAVFSIGRVLRSGFLSDGTFFYEGSHGSIIFGQYQTGVDYTFEVDIDLENGGFNLTVNESKVADFVPLVRRIPVSEFGIESSKGVTLKSLYAEGYTKAKFTEDTNSRDEPYTVALLIDEDFDVRPDIHGWTTPEYDDSRWQACWLPYPHGGERYQGESLYLRKWVAVDDFSIAELNIETLDPGGEIWINGEVVHVQHHRLPVQVDVSRYLNKHTENLIAIRVFPNKVITTNRHTSMDRHTGWFSGRAWIDFRSESYVKDLFVYATDVEADAKVQVNAVFRNDRIFHVEREMKTDNDFFGAARLTVYPWFPQESTEPVFEQAYPIRLRLNQDFKFSQKISLRNPQLWTTETPNLYRFVLTLEDRQGNPVDDFVVTSGLRVISQDGGTFRLNGKPYVMNGALLFGYKYPLEDIARTLRCGPDYWLIKQLMMVKRLNGNTIRMSIHHGNRGGVNDPRFAEFGDQLGVMFQWSTGTWVRSGSPWQLDIGLLPTYVEQVRNHPSIVMWQPGNHPKFLGYEQEGGEWMEQIYNAIYPVDPSRLISCTASNSRFGAEGAPNSTGTLLESGKVVDDPGVWNAPMIARGDMEHMTGYATDWSTIRKFPYPDDFEDQQGWRRKGFRTEYLNCPNKAWFDFESEESAGHPNQDLRKGKPYSGYRSYEVRYDDATIGRRLSSDQWRESQAWQGFSAFEAYKKKRWLDYDGQIWCTLHGGGNSATYEKPLIDYLGYSKIVFHTVKMAFQEVLVGSQNVDMVYGPEDMIPLVVMNQGDEKQVDIIVEAKELSGRVLAEKLYPNVILPAGRSAVTLDPFDPELKTEGFVLLEYRAVYSESSTRISHESPI